MKNLKNHFWQGVKDLLHIWQMEMNIILHDSGVLIFCVVVPLTYPLLYAYIYTTELMRDVPVTIVDDSKTAMSREFVRKLDATQWVQVVGMSRDIPDARQQVKEQKTYGFLVIPSDFSDNLTKGRQAYVGLYADMSGMLYYKGMLLGATDVSLDMNENLKIVRSGKPTGREDQIVAYPVKNREVALFNPQQGFAAFLLPAVLILIIQQTLFLGIGMAGGTAAEQGRYRELVPTSRHNRGTYHIICG